MLLLLQVAAAKIAVDMATDLEGKLTDQQMRSYQASMRHEHHIYERLQAAHGSSHGIPTVHFAGARRGASQEIVNKLMPSTVEASQWTVLSCASLQHLALC